MSWLYSQEPISSQTSFPLTRIIFRQDDFAEGRPDEMPSPSTFSVLMDFPGYLVRRSGVNC